MSASGQRLMLDPGFEQQPSGRMTTTNSAWRVERSAGKREHDPGFLIECIDDPGLSASGCHHVFMRLPEYAVPQEWDSVTIGQEFYLEPGLVYEASIRVRWDNPHRGNSSAIISFWARHADLPDRSYAGKDVWLTEGEWTSLSYRFMADRSGVPTFVYVSLLPHQDHQQAMDIRLDDFDLVAVESAICTDPGSTNLFADGRLQEQAVGTLPGEPWSLAQTDPGLTALVEEEAGRRYVRLAFPAYTSNYDSIRLGQHVTLKQGAYYDVQADFRWNNCSGEGQEGIVNFIAYHASSNTWYGPVDHILTIDRWHSRSFILGAPYGGDYEIYVQLLGWGNFGQPMDVAVANLLITPRSRG